MKSYPMVSWVAAFCVVAMAAKAEAVTKTFTDGVTTTGASKPYFTTGGILGFTGTATDKVDSTSMVTGMGIEIAGTSSAPDLSDNNGLPIGVRFVYDLSFTVQSTSPNSTLSDGGNNGLAVFTQSETGTNPPNRINPGEQLLFTDIVISNASLIDPLGLIQPGTVSASNALWRALRSSDIGTNARVTTSSDAAGTMNVMNFGGAGNPQIEDNLNAGAFSPMPTVYVTSGGSGSNTGWRIKSIGYQADMSFELAPTQPAERRTFKFFDLAGAYDNQPTHSITDRDTSVTITPVAPPPSEGQQPTVLDTNTTGVGVFSHSDTDPDGNPATMDALGTDGARRIAGDRNEALHFSFDREVSVESITIGNFNFSPTNGGEQMVLSFVSGVNPFEGLTGYSGNYLLTPETLIYTMSEPKAEGGPFLIPFGMGDQSEIIVQAGTVLGLTSLNVQENGILLNMITANLLKTPPGLDGDYNSDGKVDAADYVVWRKDPAAHGGDPAGYDTWRTNFGRTLAPGSGNVLGAVPEAGSAALVILAAACWSIAWRKRAI
jgi:hypothetical protein